MPARGNNPEPIATAQNFPIVGIGASAGGLEAFKQFLKAVPEVSGMAYVFVQHLHPTHQSLLPELLERVTKIPVNEITDDIHLAPDNIYIIPENKTLTSIDGVLKLTPRESLKPNNVIDIFFSSLAEVHQSLAVGIVLSGNGKDGTLGLKAIKQHGGITFAQDAKSASNNSMPECAAASGHVDFILAPQEMPAKLVEINRPFSIFKPASVNGNEAAPDIDKAEEAVLGQILSILRSRKNTDFTHYKTTTVKRRIVRRIAINRFMQASEYLEFLKNNKSEQDALYYDLLISVTSFFRDPEMFEQFCTSILPKVMERKDQSAPLRVWVAGCAAGQEAYSIAICLHKYLGNRAAAMKIQIFATDISEKAITKARTGMYEVAELEGLSEMQIRQYFTLTNGCYQINKAIRDICVFARHNMLKDPPFARIDVVTCRNVLIYMDQLLQKKALACFHYALVEKGILILGKSETTGSASGSFFTVHSNKEKIYIKKESLTKPSSRLMERQEGMQDAIVPDKTNMRSIPDIQKLADDMMLARYSPPGVVVDEQFDIRQFRGLTGKWLEPSPGKASFNLLKMAREGLAFELRNILHKAKAANAAVKKEHLDIIIAGRHESVSIEAIPLPGVSEAHYLVLFENAPSDNHAKSAVSKVPEDGDSNADIRNIRIEQLGKELTLAREDMRSITEEQEAANEELQSANEELLSGSEELQSLNEELETSQEELQSTNEELSTLNHELLDRNEQLTNARNYAEAIIETVRDPLLVLDKELRVRSATEGFYAKFAVKEQDTIGHHFYELEGCPWQNEELLRKLYEVVTQKTSFNDLEVRCSIPNLEDRVLQMNARQVANINGEQLIVLSIEDITQRRLERDELEHLVAEKTQWLNETMNELKASNQNLEEYAYIASHDLQEPLRKIQTLAGLLQRHAGEKLGEETNNLLTRISESSLRMSSMVAELLNFSKVKITTEGFFDTDLNHTVSAVIAEFGPEILQKGATIDAGKLPVIRADPSGMMQLFHNLMSNSLKFAREGVSPVIKISSRIIEGQDLTQYPTLRKDGHYAFITFSDNGIGFKQEYAEQVFVIFRGLNVRGAYDGTGMGLTICRKIVMNHRGIILVNSQEDSGTEFRIILPLEALHAPTGKPAPALP